MQTLWESTGLAVWRVWLARLGGAWCNGAMQWWHHWSSLATVSGELPASPSSDQLVEAKSTIY